MNSFSSTMAANIIPLRPAGIRVSATSSDRINDRQRRKTPSSGWWTPIFGWPAEPDYIDGEKCTDPTEKSEQAKSRLAPGIFTEEKARKLRMLTSSPSHHDVMYHSAIATRLATDFSDRSDL
ncbi:hypothetical protein LguiA_019878 [Lonicera macranthoides]